MGLGPKKLARLFLAEKILPNHDKPTQHQKKNPQISRGRKKGIFIYYGRASRRKGSNLLAAKKKPNPKDGPGAKKEARLAVFSRKKYCQTNINLRKTRKKAAIFSRPKKGRILFMVGGAEEKAPTSSRQKKAQP
jgi:hypothetical protein